MDTKIEDKSEDKPEGNLDFRNMKLWASKSGPEMWRAFRVDLDKRVDQVFAPTRPNAIVDVRQSMVQHAAPRSQPRPV